jgi:hypothetical protein
VNPKKAPLFERRFSIYPYLPGLPLGGEEGALCGAGEDGVDGDDGAGLECGALGAELECGALGALCRGASITGRDGAGAEDGPGLLGRESITERDC